MYKCNHYLLFFLLSLTVFCQNFNELDSLSVKYIGQKDGLLQLNVMDVEQDSLGYLWLSTQDGLHRYNGSQFKVYLSNPQDSSTIADDQLRDMYISKDALFAVSNSEGVLGLNLSKNKFFKLGDGSGTIGYKVLALEGGFLMFSMKNHFLLFDRVTQSIDKIELPKLDVDNHVMDLCCLLYTSPSPRDA